MLVEGFCFSFYVCAICPSLFFVGCLLPIYNFSHPFHSHSLTFIHLSLENFFFVHLILFSNSQTEKKTLSKIKTQVSHLQIPCSFRSLPNFFLCVQKEESALFAFYLSLDSFVSLPIPLLHDNIKYLEV